MIILAWILLVLGLGGISTVVGISISEARHKRRLRRMRAEADRKRADYFVLSDKLDSQPARRARFLP
jgi:hypothetical protein